jgi:hypothetical protein
LLTCLVAWVVQVQESYGFLHALLWGGIRRFFACLPVAYDAGHVSLIKTSLCFANPFYLNLSLSHAVAVLSMLLQDIENTTGSWDMYGQDSDKRYPGMQNEFFNRAGDVLKRREALRGFVALCK